MDTWLQKSPGRHRQLFLDGAFVELCIGHNKGVWCCVLGRNVLSVTASPSCKKVFKIKAVLREVKNFRSPLDLCLLMPGLEIRILWDICVSITNVHEQSGVVRVQSISAPALGHYTEQIIQGKRDIELSCFLSQRTSNARSVVNTSKPQKSLTVESGTSNDTLAMIMSLVQTCSKCLN